MDAATSDIRDGDMVGRQKSAKGGGAEIPTIGPHGREPRTQGERISWVRHQIGRNWPDAMPRREFAIEVGKRSGKKPQSITTYNRWEGDIGRGPSLPEGVAIARLGGRTVAWLAGMDQDGVRVQDAVPVDAPPGALRTMGDRIKWVRYQLGDAPWTPMTQPDFAKLITKLTGEGERHASTIHHWEHNRFDGPTLREAVAIARLVGRTAEWLSAMDDASSAAAPAAEPKRSRGAVPGHATQSRAVVIAPPVERPMRKQGHGRGRKR